MRYVLLAIMCVIVWGRVGAQSDTIYTYYNPLWKPVVKDSATFYEKKYWYQQLLKKETYRLDSNIIIRTGSFSDSAGTLEKGFFSRYNRYGIIRDSIYFEGRKRREGWFFYSNGVKRAYFHTNAKGEYDVQKGWDERGNEIAQYIAYRPAVYPGGDSVWKSYLVQRVSANQPIDYAAGKVSGEVEILFTVSPDGSVSDVRIGKSSGNKDLDTHALEVIKSSPKWQPSIQFNEHVRYFQRQSLTYSPQQQVIPQ